jgi:hypothetical protein
MAAKGVQRNIGPAITISVTVAALIALTAGAAVWMFLHLPRTIVMATGSKNLAYYEFGKHRPDGRAMAQHRLRAATAGLSVQLLIMSEDPLLVEGNPPL